MLTNGKTFCLVDKFKYYQYIVKRFKGRRNDHSSRVPKCPTLHALEYFDKFYAPVYGPKWPSIRLALLSTQKYCALVNNFADFHETVDDLMDKGAQNVLEIARESSQNLPSDEQLKQSEDLYSVSRLSEIDVQEEKEPTFQPDDIYSFMPTRKVASEIEHLKEQEAELLNQKNYEMDVTFLEDKSTHLPASLHVFAYARGDASLFRGPRMDSSKKTDYYLYDAGSVLPVLALDLVPGCSVLDLCAAPGGKTLTILQTCLAGHVRSVDISTSRLKRLENILNQYLSDSSAVDIVKSDATRFCLDYPNEKYDRVLVDAPCNTDRHVLRDPDNNLFRSSRIRDRIKLPKEQIDLLFNGIQACDKDGIIVYSTCTLAPVQNDGTVQAVLEKIWQETQIEVSIVNTDHLAESFKNVCDIQKTRFGQLVIPNVTANFGPLYFCKLKRLN